MYCNTLREIQEQLSLHEEYFEKCRFVNACDSLKIEECKIECGKYIVASLGPSTCFLSCQWMVEGVEFKSLHKLAFDMSYLCI